MSNRLIPVARLLVVIAAAFLLPHLGDAMSLPVMNQTLLPSPAWPPCSQPFQMDGIGNSLIANGGGAGRSGTFVRQVNNYKNYIGFLASAVNHQFTFGNDWDYAVGASTSERQMWAEANAQTCAQNPCPAPPPDLSNPAWAETGLTGADEKWNTNSWGLRSPLTSRSCLVLVIPTINDGSKAFFTTGQPATAYRSVLNTRRMIDMELAGWRTAFVPDETPIGLGMWVAEAHTVTCPTPCTATPTIPPVGAGCTTPCNFSDGESFGIVGVQNASGAAMTKVASGPTTNQYTVSGTTYSFDPATMPASSTVYLNYAAGPSKQSAYQDALHAWLHCDVAFYVGIPCPRGPNIVIVPIWETMVNPASGGAELPFPWYLNDGTASGEIHPGQEGSMSFAAVFKSVWDPWVAGKYGSLPSRSFLPTVNNYYPCSGNGTVGPFSSAATKCSLTGTAGSGGSGTHLMDARMCAALVSGKVMRIWFLGQDIAHTDGAGGLIDDGSTFGPIAGGGANNNYDCWSGGAQTGAWSFKTTSVLTNGTANHIVLALDNGGATADGTAVGLNILHNGLMEYDMGSQTAGCGTGTVPNYWVASCTGSVSASLTPTVSQSTNRNGYTSVKVCFGPGVLTSNGTFTLQNAVAAPGSWVVASRGQKYRGEADIEITAGPDGHLYGISWANFGVSMQSNGSTAFQRPPVGGSTNFIDAANDMTGSSLNYFTDKALAISPTPGMIVEQLMTQPEDSQMSSGVGTLFGQFQIGFGPNGTPVDGCVNMAQAADHLRQD